MNHVTLIICDLEATCWEDKPYRDEMEIIEIGAVRLVDGVVTDEFQRFIRPSLHPLLTEFCKKLTSICQEEVDSAMLFPEVYRTFLDWIGPQPFVFSSWGKYDLRQLQLDVTRTGLEWHQPLERHLNLKHLFAQWRQVKPCGMERALQLAGLPLEGTHHRGIDDARNIARLTQLMLDWLVETQPVLTEV